MPYTLAQVETALLSPGRLGQVVRATGIDPAVSPNNTTPRAFLGDAIAASLFFCGVLPADPNHPSDADLAKLAPLDFLKLVDVAEYEYLGGFFSKLTTGGGSIKWADYEKVTNGATVSNFMRYKLEMLQSKYGYGLGAPRPGTIALPTGRSRRPEF